MTAITENGVIHGVAGAKAPVRPSRRRFSLRFIEKKNGGGTKYGVRSTEFVKIRFFVNFAFSALARRGILRSALPPQNDGVLF